jgi:hypothetical protein
VGVGVGVGVGVTLDTEAGAYPFSASLQAMNGNALHASSSTKIATTIGCQTLFLLAISVFSCKLQLTLCHHSQLTPDALGFNLFTLPKPVHNNPPAAPDSSGQLQPQPEFRPSSTGWEGLDWHPLQPAWLELTDAGPQQPPREEPACDRGGARST